MREYAEYQSPGLDFVEQIPAHWKMVPFRHVFTESREVNGKTPVGPMLSVSGYRGVEVKEYDSENRRRTPEEVASYRVVRPGQLAVNTMWLNYAGLGVSDFEGHMSPAYRAYNISPSLEPRYVHHLLRSSTYVQGYTALLTGIRPNSLQMSRDDLMNFPVILPPLEEQRLIADYLDRETAEIDAAVSELKKLAELLEEEHKASITALLSGAEEKGSGHLQFLKLKYVAETIIGITYSPVDITDDQEQGTLVVRSGNIQRGKLVTTDSVRVATPIPPKSRLKLGDIVMCARNGSPKLIGKNALVEEEFVGSTWGAFMVVIRSPLNDYLRWVFNSSLFSQHAGMYSTSTINQLTSATLKNMVVPIPDEDRRLAISSQLNEKQKVFEAALVEIENAIELAQERRSALISAAVTGQIDVTTQDMSAADSLRDELEVNV